MKQIFKLTIENVKNWSDWHSRSFSLSEQYFETLEKAKAAADKYNGFKINRWKNDTFGINTACIINNKYYEIKVIELE